MNIQLTRLAPERLRPHCGCRLRDGRWNFDGAGIRRELRASFGIWPILNTSKSRFWRGCNSFSAALFLMSVVCLHAAEKDDEAVMKRNAAEQAAALNQDPGGADRNALLAARAKDKIEAGLPGQRTAHPDAQWFGNASLGLFLHWSISSAHGGIDLSWPMITNMGSGLKLKPADYWKLADKFKAEHYDPNLWLKAAKEAGFDYAVLTTKHHDGFTLWPTEASEIGVRTSLPGRDLVKEYVAACRTNGLKVGFYYSGPDWFKGKEYMSFNYRSESGGNSSLPPIPGRPDLDMNWQPTKLKPMPADVRTRIQRACRQELTELLTRYGKIDVLWFDGGTGSDITLDEIRKLQPGIVINNRGGMVVTNGGPKFAGDFFTVEHGDQPFRPPGWWEQLRIWNSTSWGYMKGDEQRYAPAALILRLLARSKAWGGSVMANCGPRPDGTMPPPFYQGMAEVRDWMNANGESIKGASPMPETAQANVPVTTRGDIWYLHAVNGSKGKLSVKPGVAVKAIKTARILRTGEPVKYQWADDSLEIEFPEPDRNTPHEVIAVTFQRPGEINQPSLLPGGADKWELVWQDEFDGPDSELEVAWKSQNSGSTHILSSRWRENAVVTNGLLRLVNRKEQRGGQEWTSGNLWTRQMYQYGYFECRYRYGAAEGLNNSFWLMPTGTNKITKGKFFEIDVNEGHYPNKVANNIHNHTDSIVVNGRKTHPSSSRSFTFGARPDVTIQLELPVTARKLRFTSSHGAHFHMGEFRIYNVNPAGYSEALSATADKDKRGLVNFAREAGTKITASGFYNATNDTRKNLADGKLETRWTSQREGDKWVEFEFAGPRTIGCVQFLNGLKEGGNWKGMVDNYRVEFHDGAKWVGMASFNIMDGEYNFARDFQVHGLDWNEQELVFYLNGKEIRRVKNEFCFSPASVWLSEAIIPWAGRITDAIDGTAMEVDYVRIYRRKP